MSFRWDKVRKGIRFWDRELEQERISPEKSDLETIKNPDSSKFEDVLNALCRVTVELTEIARHKNEKDQSER